MFSARALEQLVESIRFITCYTDFVLWLRVRSPKFVLFQNVAFIRASSAITDLLSDFWFEFVFLQHDLTEESCYTLENQAKLANAIMNRMFYDSFIFGMQNRMKCLSLNKFNRKVKGIRMLKNSQSSQTLI